MDFDMEKILNIIRDHVFAIKVQRAVEIIFQKTRNELTAITKAKGGHAILTKVSKELKKEGVNISFSDKILCSHCGTLLRSEKDCFHRADKFYCIRCAGGEIINDVMKMKEEHEKTHKAH